MNLKRNYNSKTWRNAIALSGAALLLALNVQAKDFGVIGTTFPIGEIDMLKWIEQRLKTFEANGKMEDMQQAFEQRVKESIKTPPPVEGLLTTSHPVTFFVNPSLTIPKDIMDPNTGAVIAPKGTVINPFDSTTWPKASEHDVLPRFELSKVLVFLDARDARQRRFAVDFRSDKPIKWILTGGSPDDMADLLRDRIYFDQQGHLTQKLHLNHVPSIASQDGTRWKIQEVDVSNTPPLSLQ